MTAYAINEPLPPLALLAGGLATRLRPITAAIPKSMVCVAGEPFIRHQLRLLAREGVRDIVICNGHLGEQIESYVGDGAWLDCRVRYSSDGSERLGTGGAIKRALPLLGKCFFVMYGDSYLEISFRRAYEAFRSSGKSALMTVLRNEGRWDSSNVEFTNGSICKYDKVNRTASMQYVDYGLGLFDANVIASWPERAGSDLADIYRDLAEGGLLGGYEIKERFYEIGSPAGLAETDRLLRARAVGQGRT
jgi:NDP-sugar pyrophosphorylase family protein